MWNFCTLSSRSLQCLAFDVFFPVQTPDALELSKRGDIDLYSYKDRRCFRDKEIKSMLQLLFGKNYMSNPQSIPIQARLEKLSRDKSWTISTGEFIEFSKQTSMLVFPAFALQHTIQVCMRFRCILERVADSYYSVVPTHPGACLWRFMVERPGGSHATPGLRSVGATSDLPNVAHQQNRRAKE